MTCFIARNLGLLTLFKHLNAILELRDRSVHMALALKGLRPESYIGQSGVCCNDSVLKV